jgi:hypothetical protein
MLSIFQSKTLSPHRNLLRIESWYWQREIQTNPNEEPKDHGIEEIINYDL